MRMVPAEMLRPVSDAERKIFDLLRAIDLGKGSTALHSLNLPAHEYKKWAEADFVLLCAEGILLLEIKGGGVACRNGMWHFTNRFGETATKRESPAAQAAGAFFSLRDKHLFPHFGTELRGVVMGWGVVFKDIPSLFMDRSSDIPEQPSSITAYSRDCLGPNQFRAFLQRTLEHWRSKERHHQVLDPELIGRLLNHLRPDFEQVPPIAARIEDLQTCLASLTEEQYARLDELQENDRMVVRGGAGTGKTFLALACARYEAARGNSVLFTTRSRFLVDFLNRSVELERIDIIPFDDLEPQAQSRDKPWTCLIIDEGQDLCQMSSLQTFDRVLDGGLESGRWRWFGDPNHQVSSSHNLDPDALAYLESLGTKCSLKQNVRNAPQVVTAIQRYITADLGIPAPKGHGAEMILRQLRSDERLSDGVLAVIREWSAPKAGVKVKLSDIAVMVCTPHEVQDMVTALAGAGFRAEPIAVRRGAIRAAITIATVEDFKGLERPLICVAGLCQETEAEEQLQTRIYRSFSRANHTLALVYNNAEAKMLARLAVKKVQS